VSAAVVNGNPRRRKAWIGKRADGDAHRLIVTLFAVEDSSPTNRAKPEDESGSLVPDTHVFGGRTEDFERSREAGQCREDTAGPLLAGEAVANADAAWFAFDLNAQLSAATCRSSGHCASTVEAAECRTIDLKNRLTIFIAYPSRPWTLPNGSSPNDGFGRYAVEYRVGVP